MGFDFGAMGDMFGSPIVLGLLAIVLVAVLGLFAYIVIRNVRGGFGRMSRPKDIFQKCICITPSNNLALYRLKVQDEYVEDERNMGCHFLYSDALVPEKKTGTMWLPVDSQASTPLYLFDEALQKSRNKYAEDNIRSIAVKEDSRQNMTAQAEAIKTVGMEMQKFALVASFIVLLLIVIVILVVKMF